MKLASSIQLRRSSIARGFPGDRRGVAAIEFALILPVMVIMLFGTIEFSSAVAVKAKVTIMARTLSDLTSQSTTVGDTDMTNFFAASTAIMTPYPTTSVHNTITERYIDPATKQGRVQWSKGSAPRATSSTVNIPTQLQVGDTYLIFSEVSYTYTPTVTYVMPSAIALSDVSYTRPRQSTCVYYSPATACTKL